MAWACTLKVARPPTQTSTPRPLFPRPLAKWSSSFGVDFNRAGDRLRVVSDTGQNLRHYLNDDTTTADGPLKNGDATATGVAGAAYTNNDVDATTGTTLFDADTALDQISIQSPPNNGNLVAIGKLGVDAAAPVGFDVDTTLVDGIASGNWGFAAVTVDGTPGFYRVNLLTGRDPDRHARRRRGRRRAPLDQ